MAEEYGITIAQAVAEKIKDFPAQKSNYNGLLRDIKNSGILPDSDLSVFNSKEGYETLLKYVKQQNRSSSSTANTNVHARSIIQSAKPDDREITNVHKSIEDKLLKKGTPELGFNRVAQRDKSDFEYPPQKKMHQAIDRGLMQIKDPNVRSWATVKLLTGLRNPDISQIELEPEDRSRRKDGVKYLARNSATVFITNKGRPIHYDLGDVSYHVLREQAELAKKRKGSITETGSIRLWPISEDPQKVLEGKQSSALESKYRTQINKAINDEFKKKNIEIFNLKQNTVEGFSLKHLRKNIFDVLEEQIGAGLANPVLGHKAKTGDMGLQFYKVRRQGRREALSRTIDLFFNTYLKDVGVKNPKNWTNKLGFKQASENVSSVIDDTPLGMFGDKVEKASVSVEKMSQEQLDKLSEMESELDKTSKRIEAKQKKLEELQSTQPQTGSTQQPKKSSLTEEQRATRRTRLRALAEKSADVTSKDIFSNKPLPLRPIIKGITAIAAGLATAGASTAVDAALQIIEPSPIGGVAEDTSVEDIPSSELLRSMESGERTGTTGDLIDYSSELDKRLEDQQEQNEQEKVLEESTQPRSERFRRLSRAREEQQGYYFAKDSDYDVRLTEENVGRAKQVFGIEAEDEEEGRRFRNNMSDQMNEVFDDNKDLFLPQFRRQQQPTKE